MKEIGGYIEFETFRSKMLYDDGIKLNCGRNAFAYLIETENIKKVCFPKMMCDSDDKVLGDYGVEVRYYSIDRELKMEDIVLEDDEWLYVVNYYGQLTDEYIKSLKKKCGFKKEGVKRGSVFKNGEYYDVCMYSILREEYMEVKGNE